MTTIGSGSSGVPSSPPLTDAERDASSDAVDDVKKAVSKNIEQRLDTTRTTADEFQQKVTSSLIPSQSDLAKAQAQFDTNYSPEIVGFLEENLKLTIDPIKVIKVQSQINTDPFAQNALGTIKDAIEQTNRDFLANWKPPVLTPPPATQPTQTQELLVHAAQDTQTTQVRESAAAAARLTPPLEPSVVLQRTVTLNVAQAQTQSKAGGTKLEQTRNSELQSEKLEDTKQGALADQKSLDKSVVDSLKVPAAVALAGATGANALPGKPGAAKAAGAGLVPETPAPAIPVGAGLNPLTPTPSGSGQSGSGNSGGNAPLPTPTPPQWGSPGPLTPAQAKATIGFLELTSRLDAGDAAECALVVLMDAVQDVDKDIKAQQNLLDMRHKVNDAMREYQQKFYLESRTLSGDNSLEWQQMSFDIGYDPNGNMIVTSFPDATWATGSYDHVEGKGAHDISPSDGFQNNTGSAGMQEAQANGSFHQVDPNTVIGLTSWRQLKEQSVPAEADFIRSQLSSMKQDNDVISQELQKLMDLRKNIIEQFGKIYQARSDAWDQQIALMAQ